jgi:hypothetical protein
MDMVSNLLDLDPNFGPKCQGSSFQMRFGSSHVTSQAPRDKLNRTPTTRIKQK